MGKPIFWKLPVHPRGEIYTVFNEESESEVEKCQIPGPEERKKEKPTPGIPGSNFLKD